MEIKTKDGVQIPPSEGEGVAFYEKFIKIMEKIKEDKR